MELVNFLAFPHPMLPPNMVVDDTNAIRVLCNGGVVFVKGTKSNGSQMRNI